MLALCRSLSLTIRRVHATHSIECVMCARAHCIILTPPFVPTLRIRWLRLWLRCLFIYFLLCDRFFLRVLAFNLRWCVFVSLTRFTIECFDSPNMIGSWSTRRENILNEADSRGCLCTFLWYLVRSILLCRVHVADGDDGKQFDRFLHICTVYSETNARTKSKLSCSSQSVEVHMPCAFAREGPFVPDSLPTVSFRLKRAMQCNEFQPKLLWNWQSWPIALQ